MEFKSVDEILDFAIEREEEAAKFYTELAGKMSRPSLAQVFKDFAKEEWGHKATIQDIKKGRTFAVPEEKVLNLKIAEFVEDVPSLDIDFNYQKALILAMNREKRAYKLYMDLAKSTDDAGVKNIFTILANEEAKHKLFFETEYDETYLAEN
jgi:rubrerythrin